ncbi:MAG: diaminopimelate dehydrogenase [Bacteroidetes bacterium]|nr:diaminopimelate dehydrogenase [Bacteroidota bacterium]MCL1968165.1 diaminopimelate dehydrogenase [Bacteroidota bacterium]
MSKIRLGIVGYGNVGRGVECAIKQNDDMELVAIFTRRNIETIKTSTAGVKVYNIEEAENHIQNIDVMMLCGGSATDLMVQTPHFAALYNCIDSFDTHAKIPEYFTIVDEIAKKSNKISIISTGWDPGLFSLMRVLGMACLPKGCDYTFWGKGVSQGHSDAIRRITGVKYAVQYTIPVDSAVEEVRKGNNPILTTRQKHIRECFVVAEPNADLNLIEHTIKIMPNYFSDYDTIVHFISEEEFKNQHTKMPHGGFVFRTGTTGNDNKNQQRMEFSLQLDSNPEFTAGVMVAYARAAHHLYLKGEAGAKTVFDVPIGMLVTDSMTELRAKML